MFYTVYNSCSFISCTSLLCTANEDGDMNREENGVWF